MTEIMTSNPKRDPDIETTSLPDGYAVLVMKKTDWAHTINPLAAIVWEFCDGTNSVDEIIALIQAVPELEPRPQLREEVIGLLNQFEADGFLLSE